MMAEQPSSVAGVGQAYDDREPEAGPASAVAGGAVDVDADDDAAVCSTLFRGLVFFLGCADLFRPGTIEKEVPTHRITPAANCNSRTPS